MDAACAHLSAAIALWPAARAPTPRPGSTWLDPGAGVDALSISLQRSVHGDSRLPGIDHAGRPVVMIPQPPDGSTFSNVVVERAGTISPWPGAAAVSLNGSSNTNIVEVHEDSLYFIETTVERFVATKRLVHIGPHGARTVLPGGRPTTDCDGPYDAMAYRDGGLATDACLHLPLGLAVGPDGSIYLRDGFYLRRVTPDGRIELLAGGRGGTPQLEGEPALGHVLLRRPAHAPGGVGVVAG